MVGNALPVLERTQKVKKGKWSTKEKDPTMILAKPGSKIADLLLVDILMSNVVRVVDVVLVNVVVVNVVGK